MKNVLNQSLFTHQSGATEGFNNLCTIIHQLHEEGVYFGEVLRAKHIIGTFIVRFDKKLPTHEVHIDAAIFDPLFNKDKIGQPAGKAFEVGGQGYVVLYTSGSHGDLRIKLHRRDEKNAEVSYDTAKLAASDMVVFRLWKPGTYRIRHSEEKHAMTLSVRPSDGGRYPTALGKFPPVNVKLTPRGFDPAEIEQWPAQALIIQTEISGALRVDSLDKVVAK
ncbi:MAG: hypothetical protein NTU53_06935 [Planctomycetota bacterium]|nr:hypothetical protein [Planctomycetota bacterium]